MGSDLTMCVPTFSPTVTPTAYPSGQPSSVPSGQPSKFPTGQPTSQPTNQPSGQPSDRPTSRPSPRPTVVPTNSPSVIPTTLPTSAPTPTRTPTVSPSGQPTGNPTRPTVFPTLSPSVEPSVTPTHSPTELPTAAPTPTKTPTSIPTVSPTDTPTSEPTFEPTKAIIIIQPLLTEDETIAVSLVCSFVGFIVIAFIVYQNCFSSKAVKSRRRKDRLKALPIHRMLYSGRNNTEEDMLKVIEQNLMTSIELDTDDRIALDIALQKCGKFHVTEEVVYRLLLNSLPVNIETGEVYEEPSRAYGWARAVQVDDDIVVNAVFRILNYNRKYAESLAFAGDSNGRSCKDIAGPRNKEAIYKKLYLFERFEVKEGPPEHRSATSLVVFAKDHGVDPNREKLNSTTGGGNSGSIRHVTTFNVESHDVALKFMLNREQFLKEVDIRAKGDFDDKFVLPVIMDFDSDRESESDKDFRADAIYKGYRNYPYCIVMEAAQQSLKRIIDHEHIAGMNWNTVKEMTRNLCNALHHIHEKGVIHGDLKPLNVLLVGTTLKLTDLDAAANFNDGDLVGTKYSSGYIPPEQLTVDEFGEAVVRSDDDLEGLLVAHPSQDMWALGCVLYLLSTGSTLFHVNTEDNIVNDEDLIQILDWNTEIKTRKLKAVKNKLAKNLLSLLLTEDVERRPLPARVLSHPFITGTHATRLQGEPAVWDIFLSYRVQSDAGHVQMMYEALTAKGLKVWWDKLCLLPGQNWEEGFCSGLVSSASFVCLLSKGAIRNPDRAWQNFENLKKDSNCDNVLLEWRLALELKERNMLQGVFPIMIGEKDETTGNYSHYFRGGCNPNAPDTEVDSIEEKLRDHLDREGLGSPFQETLTVKQILTIVLANQGGFWVDDPVAAVNTLSDTIVSMTKQRQRRLSDAAEPIKLSNRKSVAGSRFLLSAHSTSSGAAGGSRFPAVQDSSASLASLGANQLKLDEIKEEHEKEKIEIIKAKDEEIAELSEKEEKHRLEVVEKEKKIEVLNTEVTDLLEYINNLQSQMRVTTEGGDVTEGTTQLEIEIQEKPADKSGDI